MTMALDLMHIHNSYGQMLAGVNNLWFLPLMKAFLCVLKIKKYILVLSEGLTQWSDDITVRAEGKYSINFTQNISSLH